MWFMRNQHLLGVSRKKETVVDDLKRQGRGKTESGGVGRDTYELGSHPDSAKKRHTKENRKPCTYNQKPYLRSKKGDERVLRPVTGKRGKLYEGKKVIDGKKQNSRPRS